MNDEQLEQQVLSISFDDDGIAINWLVPSDNDDRGATVYQSLISVDGLEASDEVKYWAGELRQSADELLAQWRRFRRKK